jgi:D-3-phosphoglycerate dehydrogenase
MHPTLIFDFDSTLVSLESLDELANIALDGNPDREDIVKELVRITDLGMEGKIGFAESLESRLKMFSANRGHVEKLTGLLRDSLSASVLRNTEFLKNNADRIYVISGGFSDYIQPVVAEICLLPENVLANKFVFDGEGRINGHDKSLLLAQDNGKAKQVAAMKLEGPVYIIGDGYTDFQIKAQGEADRFVAFTENIERPNVIAEADDVVKDFDELLELEFIRSL